MKFIIVAVDYFTKWVEVEVVPWIKEERVRHFNWRNIICHFGMSGIFVSDNGTKFTSSSVV